ncbi:MAG: hypothetical protein HAW58_05985, partial [Candidatus Thioglobus sp.]|nr:hypothetical protein [Candidatus Thioglobus sp.]
CVQSFVGDILQVPPMFSALKKDGQPLYKLARKGLKIERQPKRGLQAEKEAKKTGVYFSSDEVLAELEAMLLKAESER